MRPRRRDRPLRAEISSAVQEASRGGLSCGVEGRKAPCGDDQRKEPSGICGTGIIEILYCLLEARSWVRSGRLEAPWDSEGFPVDEKGNIRIYQKDIREIQLAKAAVRAGLETLLAEYGITAPDVEEICLAGGFGYEMDVRKASGHRASSLRMRGQGARGGEYLSAWNCCRSAG